MKEAGKVRGVRYSFSKFKNMRRVLSKKVIQKHDKLNN